MAKNKREPKITVQQNPEKQIGADVLAEEILKISQGMKILCESRLSREAIVVLIKANSGVPKSTIEVILNNLDDLEKRWLKRK